MSLLFYYIRARPYVNSKNSYRTEKHALSSFFSMQIRHDKTMASRVYKSLPKKGGHAHREHRSKKGRTKKLKPDYALQARQAKREKRDVARQVTKALTVVRIKK
jgi:hypothetical protein